MLIKRLLLLAAALIAQPAFAEQTELSLFTGYRVGGEFDNASTDSKVELDESNSLGLILSRSYGKQHMMEFLYSKQSTYLRDQSAPAVKLLNLDVEYFQVGGNRIWRSQDMDSFFGADIGAIHLSPSSSSFSSTTRLSMSFAGGAVFNFTKNLGLRLELRAYFATLGNSRTFCDSNNQCVVVGDGFMRQVDLNAGLRFRF
ncbi:hypothetical protein MNBD_GAMMA09-1896 [hydrothermal vent metagenome]|uniref:Outer membrane protein beta-barrel domain-containing protein n=1 Tax=hydrothermal vent metagenome TaxID=652676 RepID=A0A3B0YJ74_9ZZZZ